MRSLLVLGAIGLAAAAQLAPEEYVDIRSGTRGIPQFSRGNLLPLVTTPWSFNAWTLFTDTADGNWFWNPLDRNFLGIRCTHRPSPWISDWGHFNFLPLMVGGRNDHYDGQNAFSVYDPDAATTTWSPYYFATELGSVSNDRGSAKLEFVPTSHAAMARVTYPALSITPTSLYNETRVLRFGMPTNLDKLTFTPGSGVIKVTGYTMSESNPTNQLKTYVVAEIHTNATLLSTTFTYNQVGVALFNTNANDFIVKIATSLISEDQAWTSLATEVGSSSFDDVKAAAKKEWNDVLTKIEVTPIADADDTLNVFYSSFYRAAQFPRFLSEFNGTGEFHFSTYTSSTTRYHAYQNGLESQLVFSGPLATDSGFWDSYRTVYPFLGIVDTTTLGRMLQGWLNAYSEGGWLPKWASPGYRNDMVGTMGDVVFADAIVNGVQGFNQSLALEALFKDAYTTSNTGGKGRENLADYLKYGYLPEGSKENVAVTLNFMLSDYAISKAASVMGQTQKADELMARSKNYDKIFNRDGFFRSKDTSGAFTEPFDQFAWGGSYTESGPWQYRFYVPHDPKGLADVYSKNGLDVCERLLAAQTGTNTFHVGAYGGIIHEMVEMQQTCWGQYAHNNQPVHHMLYMFAGVSDAVSSSCAQTGQYWLRKGQTELYVPGLNMYPGDEDNGEMAAWYLLTSLGLYTLAPGSGELVLGMPLFSKATVKLPTGKTLTITSDEPVPASGTMKHDPNSKTYPVVKSVAFNGQQVNGTTIAYKSLMQGGTLAFQMGTATKTW